MNVFGRSAHRGKTTASIETRIHEDYFSRRLDREAGACEPSGLCSAVPKTGPGMVWNEKRPKKNSFTGPCFRKFGLGLITLLVRFRAYR